MGSIFHKVAHHRHAHLEPTKENRSSLQIYSHCLRSRIQVCRQMCLCSLEFKVQSAGFWFRGFQFRVSGFWFRGFWSRRPGPQDHRATRQKKSRRRPTLARAGPALPSAMRRLTSVFGMGTGMAASLWPPANGRCRESPKWGRAATRRGGNRSPGLARD